MIFMSTSNCECNFLYKVGEEKSIKPNMRDNVFGLERIYSIVNKSFIL